MAIVVDDAKVKSRGKTWYHMATDNGDLEALDKFAQSIGLQRHWRHDGSIPHYDLTPSKRELAIKRGAKPISNRDMIDIVRAWRNRQTDT